MDIKKLLEEENLLTASEAMRVLGLDSARQVNQLVEDGVLIPKMVKTPRTGEKLIRRYDFIPTIHQYTAYLRSKSDKRIKMLPPGLVDDATRKTKAEADLKEQQAKIVKMKADEYEGMLHRAEDVKAVVGDMVTRIRSELLALPGSLANDAALAQTPAEAAGVIKNAVNDLLNHLTDYKYTPSDYKKRVRQREKWMNEQHESDGEDDE